MKTNLPDRIYKTLDENTSDEVFVQEFKDHPVVHFLAHLSTGSVGGAVATYIDKQATQLLRHNDKIFFEELRTDHKKLSMGVIQSNEFIRKFLVTLRAIRLTLQDEKIKYFARLFEIFGVAGIET